MKSPFLRRFGMPSPFFDNEAGFSPTVLLAGSTAMVWLDPSDLTTLFQDAAGTTPVTAPAQPVGMVLDKSQGLVLGSNVADPSFNNPSSWAVAAQLAVTGGNLVLSAGGAGGQGAYTAAPVSSGAFAEVVIEVNAVSGTAIQFEFCDDLNGANGTGLVTLASTSGTFRQIVRKTGSQTGVRLRFGAGAGVTASVAALSVRELPGFHASQSTAASRPTYGVVPSRGRVNLLTFTEQFDNAVWTKNAATVVANSVAAPDGTTTADTITENTANDVHVAFQSANLPAATAYTLSCYIRANTSNFAMIRVGGGGFATAPAVKATLTGSGSVSTIEGPVTASSITSVGGGWYRVSMTFTSLTATSYAPQVGPHNDGSAVVYTGDGVRSVYIWGAQLETGSTATAYQRVVSQFEVTDPVGFPSYPLHYLSFDGVDDFLVTPTITPNADKVQVFAGVRKLGDVNACLVEYGQGAASGIENSFVVLVPPSSSSGYRINARGTTLAQSSADSPAFPGAHTAVLAGTSDLQSFSVIRVNGAPSIAISPASGTQFPARQMTIGRRIAGTNPFNGQLYGLITRFSTANLDASVISQTERWMGGKTGVTIA